MATGPYYVAEEVVDFAQVTGATGPPESGIRVYAQGNVLHAIHYGGEEFHFLGSHPSIIHVSKTTQANFSTIKDALAEAATLGPCAIWVLPGTYVEDNPLTIPANVSVYSEGGAYITTVVPMNPNSNLFEASAGSFLSGLHLTGVTGASAIYYDGAQLLDHNVRECLITNCDVGVESENGPGRVFMNAVMFASTATPSITTINKCLWAHDGGAIHGATVPVIGIPGNRIGKGIVSEGKNGTSGDSSIVNIFNSAARLCDTGVEINEDGHIQLSAFRLTYNGIGTQLNGTGTDSDLNYNGVSFADNTTDLDIQTSQAHLVLLSCQINHEKLINPNSNPFYATLYSEAASNDRGQKVVGEFHVGLPYAPTESAFGEGDSHVFGMSVLSNTNQEVGTWADHTPVARLNDASTFNAFPSNFTNACLYMGGDHPYSGIKY